MEAEDGVTDLIGRHGGDYIRVEGSGRCDTIQIPRTFTHVARIAIAVSSPILAQFQQVLLRVTEVDQAFADPSGVGHLLVGDQ